MKEFEHIPVLLTECIDGLNIKKDGTYVDATVGGGGHSYHILSRLKSGHLYCFDQDQMAIEASRERLSKLSCTNFTLIHSNFSFIKEELAKLNISKIDGILFDLGVSSFQLDEPSRGFSYRFDAELDMRMNQENKLTAKEVVNQYAEEELTRIFFEYGEEKYSKKIAHNIIETRKTKTIETTFQLVDIIKKSVPLKEQIMFGHPAKRVFQAIRIEVNHELDILKNSLQSALSLLNSGGRCCVITFHSLEDKIVKKLFQDLTTEQWHRGMPVNINYNIEYKLISKKAIIASDDELNKNNRSHSAKLRIIEKI